MDAVDKLTIALVITVVMIVFTIWKTKTSKDISNKNKNIIYVLSILAPIVGLILYFVYKNDKNKTITA